MEKFNYAPNSAAYTGSDGNTVIGTELDGGLSRNRQDQINASSKVQCQWILESKYDFDRWRDFYLGVARSGAVRFLMDLVIDYGEPTEYVCNFIPGTYSFDGRNGPVHIVSCQVEAAPIAIDYEYRAALWMIDNEYGSLENGLEVVNLLEQFVNVDLPDTFGDLNI